MKSIRSKLLLAALIIIASLYAGNQYYKMYLISKANEEHSAARAELRKAQLAAENTRPLADKAIKLNVPKNYSRPVSDWKTTEKSVYEKLLSSGHFDVLVVPFQVQEYALDCPTRSLMTAEFVLALSAAQKIQLPDPYLVARALGDCDRRLNPTDVYNLASKIGAKKIIWGYAGHNRHNKMSLTIQTQERRADGILNEQVAFSSKSFELLPFSDEHPPIDVYQPMLPELLKAAGMDGPMLSAIKQESRIDTAELPSSPQAMLAENQEPARDASYFQLLAYLTPEAEARTRERFAEKSLLAIFRMTQDSPDYKILKARAYMLLGLRSAALQILKDPQPLEEKELVAMLNGNQPDVVMLSAQIRPGIRGLLAKLDANNLAYAYWAGNKKESIATVTSLKLPGKIWPILAARSFTDPDIWSLFDNIYLKQLLDDEFPIKNFTVEGLVRGSASIDDLEKLQVTADLAVVKHIRKLLDNDEKKWCCNSVLGHPDAMDYLNLIEAIGEDNLMRRARFTSDVQGLPDRTLEFLGRIESVYKDNPQFTLLRADAQAYKASQLEGSERDVLFKSAYSNAFNALYWEQGQTKIAAYALKRVNRIPNPEFGSHGNFYSPDYPFRAYYPYFDMTGEFGNMSAENAEAALKNSTSDLSIVGEIDEMYSRARQTDKREALLKKLDGRFIGNPSLYQFLASKSRKKGDSQSEEKYYRESIKFQPKFWEAYSALGSLLIKQGQVGNAAELFMSYPGFKQDSDVHPVTISNAAYEAGSKFYWMGEFSLAIPFYKVASRKPTGSGGDMSSSLRLKLLNGDYRGALIGSLEQAKRYNNSYAFRDYLGLLHVMGASKDAWNGFNMLSNQIDEPQLWESVLVGHRKDNKTEAEIAAWAKQLVSDNIGRLSNRAAKSLLLAGITDRNPTRELASSLTEVELPVYLEFGQVTQPLADGRGSYFLGPRGALSAKKPTGASPVHLPKARIKSDIVYFAESYQEIRKGEIASAQKMLHEAATFYDLTLDHNSYLLPYFAFASAKNGDVSVVENYIKDYGHDQMGFDYFLAKAIISGIGGKTEESLEYLKKALYRRPHTEERPIQTEYQYAEFCEWLYDVTGAPQYREFALDWAKKNQKFQPWFAWPYAMEARLSNNKAERKRAIAMALYLDPQSERLGNISIQEREAAIKLFKVQNPFLNTPNATMEKKLSSLKHQPI